ncbi:hypothetical protein NPIL_568331 [Nephila pilipes]|uniref:Uncharacterized protein n=1 Tax=Nephila pilipes TaxID=299642 RepID=A0A8X6IMA7_NEPPI|nr:hypothetical protein NPIL_568331 [Nephila pilipes]
MHGHIIVVGMIMYGLFSELLSELTEDLGRNVLLRHQKDGSEQKGSSMPAMHQTMHKSPYLPTGSHRRVAMISVSDSRASLVLDCCLSDDAVGQHAEYLRMNFRTSRTICF